MAYKKMSLAPITTPVGKLTTPHLRSVTLLYLPYRSTVTTRLSLYPSLASREILRVQPSATAAATKAAAAAT